MAAKSRRFYENQSEKPYGSRWVRPIVHTPKRWKAQLSTKHLKLAEQGNLKSVQCLIRECPDTLNQRGPHGRTLLFEAVRRNRVELAQWLLAQGADPSLTGSVNSESFVQLSPLAASVFYRRAELTSLLISHGAEDDVFRLTVRNQTKHVLRELRQHPELIHAEDPNDAIYFTPLMSFAIVGNSVGVANLLLERGFDVVPYSFQLLFLASHFDNRVLLDLLLRAGATPEPADASLWMASNKLDVLGTLIEHGLSANQRPYNDLTPLLYIARADKGTRLDKLKLVLDHGADVSATSYDGRTALHYAAVSGNLAACTLLLEAGVDPQACSETTPPAAQVARTKGFDEIATAIEQH